MPSLFISYRREDSAGFAGRLTDALEQRLGAGSVFRDVDDIPPGAHFEAVIERGLQQVQAVLVIIGPHWLTASAGGQRRLDRDDDYVRREVEQALASGKPVVPVLVGGAVMPSAEDLPMSIRGLANRHALSLNDASWATDLQRLQDVLTQWFATPPVPRRRWWGAVLGAAMAGLALAGWLMWHETAPGSEALQGEWRADVVYPWNLSVQEHFEFLVRGGTLEGSASFLGVPREIEQPEWQDGRLRFVTRAEAVSGNDPPRQLVQRYELWPEDEALRVRLTIHRGHGVDTPLEFVARRP